MALLFVCHDPSVHLHPEHVYMFALTLHKPFSMSRCVINITDLDLRDNEQMNLNLWGLGGFGLLPSLNLHLFIHSLCDLSVQPRFAAPLPLVLSPLNCHHLSLLPPSSGLHLPP